MSSLVCYRLGHALQQWDRYPRSTERISCIDSIAFHNNIIIIVMLYCITVFYYFISYFIVLSYPAFSRKSE